MSSDCTYSGAELYRPDAIEFRNNEALYRQAVTNLRTWINANPALEGVPYGSHRNRWCPRVFRKEVKFCNRPRCDMCGGDYGSPNDDWLYLTDHRGDFRLRGVDVDCPYILGAHPSDHGNHHWQQGTEAILQLAPEHAWYIPGRHTPIFVMTVNAATHIHIPVGWRYRWHLGSIWGNDDHA